MASLRLLEIHKNIIGYSVLIGTIVSLITFCSNWLMLIHEGHTPTNKELVGISFYYFIPLISWTLISIGLLAFAEKWSRQTKTKTVLWMALIGLLVTPLIRSVDILIDFSIKFLLGMIHASPFDVLNDVWLVVISSTPAGFFRLVMIGVIIHYFFSSERRAGTLTIKSTDGTYHVLNKGEIIYLQSDGNYLDICAGSGVYRTRKTLKSFEEIGGNAFFRIHKSTIINGNHISQFHHWRNGEYLFIMSNDKPLTSSKSYKKVIDMIKTHLLSNQSHKNDPIQTIVHPTTG